MKRNLVIFGTGEMGELAHFYFTRQERHKVVAFTMDGAYIKSSTHCGLPVIPFESIVERYPPADHDMFIALGYAKINRLRRDKYEIAKSWGYPLASYLSPHARVLSEYAIGDNCFVFEDNVIQPFVRVGNNVTLWSGNHIGHHSIIGDHCFVASHVVISGGVTIGPQCFLGVNATIRDHIQIGARCIVGAGTLILGDAAPDGVYIGTHTPRSPFPSSEVSKV